MALLDEHVSRHAAARPGAEAVCDGTDRLSYAALECQASAVARRLVAAGVEPGGMVLLSMNRSVWTIAAMAGVMRAGAVYVPLEVRTPQARRRQIIEGCRPVAAVVDAAGAQALTGDEQLAALGASILQVGEASPAEPGPALPAPEQRTADDLACVLYTSGSTGRPKGVMLSHRNVDEYVRWAVERIGIGPDDRVLSTAPFYFDMSLFDIYCALRAGAALCVATRRVLMFPKTLLRFAEEERVTVWKGVSSLLEYLSRTGAIGPERIPSLRAVLFGGEELHPKYLRDWMLTFPAKSFYNFYGPTEATGASCYYELPGPPLEGAEKVPIGGPCENTDLYLLDERLQRVDEGAVGEIALAGVCVTQGYLNDPDRTQRVFREDPFRPGQRMYLTGDLGRRLEDGTLLFVGRRDNQIKYMGYRIDLGDIENALIAVEGVAAAGVLLAPNSMAGVEELVAYVVLDEGKKPAHARAGLEKLLPFYMLPKRFLPIERLPQTDRGKLDRAALRAQHLARSETP
jgi:amino acid adenylation domain-containing protein